MIKFTRVLHYRAYQRFNASLREKDPRSEISLTKQGTARRNINFTAGYALDKPRKP